MIGGFNGAEGQQGNNVIIAGNGSNTIYGNGVVGIKGATGGNNLIVGGSGADTIYGAFGSVSPSDGGEGGRNLIVSGGGADVVYASQQTDGAEGGHGSILVSGTTNLGQAALLAVLSEWTSERDYLTRVTNILGIGTGPRNNGSNFLLPGVTVYGDAVVDQLFGDTQGQFNWFLLSVPADQFERYKSGEVIIGLP
ncbi:MAG: hypothetical protein K2Y37_04820 [Pirellulales bacterium]|nr:hypothetical protein [Pirellulales bacterium]